MTRPLLAACFLAAACLVAVVAHAAANAPAVPPPLPRPGQKLRKARRRPAPRILTLAPGQKRISPEELRKGLTPEQKTALQSKTEAGRSAHPRAAPRSR